MDEKDIISWLQSYKGYLQRLLGFSVHLFWNGEPAWSQRQGAAKFDDILVDRSVHGLPILSEQVRAGLVVQIIDGWFELLSAEEGYVLFARYVNHDFEKPRSWFEEMRHCENGKMRYKSLPFRKIAEGLGVAETTAREIREAAIKNLLETLNKEVSE